MVEPREKTMPNFAPDRAAVWFEVLRAKAFHGAVVGHALADRKDFPNPMAMYKATERSPEN